MTTLPTYRLRRSAALLAVALLATLPTAQARDAEPATVKALLTFHDSSESRITLEDQSFSIDTIAGKIRLYPRDITTATLLAQESKAIMALRNGERWSVDADALTTALLGRNAARSRNTDNYALRSISITSTTLSEGALSHSYKILFKDNSIAIIDPATVSLQVHLESGKDEIPLGSLNAIKFAIPRGQKVPDSIFVGLNSGQVYKLSWAGGKQKFSCKSLTGNRLTITYTDILGLLPSVSGIHGDPGNTPYPQIRVKHLDMTETTTAAPLQIWSFKTPYGRLSLPSTFVSSFTIPQRWREQGMVYTIYGECFEGKPDFRYLIHHQEGQAQSIALKSLLQVEQVPIRKPLPLSSTSATIYLAGGFILAGTPYTLDLLIETPEGTAILPKANSSITQTKGGLLIYAPPHGGPVIGRPVSSGLEIALFSNGQKVKLDWERIEKMEFNRPIRTSEADLNRDMTAPSRDEALPTGAADESAELERTNHDTQSRDKPTESRFPSLFGRFRSQHSGDSISNAQANTLSLKRPWGTITLNPDQISTILQGADDDTAIITTASGDVILAASRALQGGDLATSVAGLFATTDSSALFALRAYTLRADNAVRIRLTSGDIITGTFADDRLPFAPTDSNDPRDHVTVDSLRRIIGTGKGTLLYETRRGSQTGKATRDRLAFKPASSPSTIRIALRDIEAILVGSEPLPPPVTHSADRPPALSGMVYLPGGSFTQGSGETGMTDEAPKITVTLSPFFLDATEVTHAQFSAFVRDSGYKTTADRTGSTTTWMNPGFLQQPDDPAVCVSWTDAAEFCNWRSRQSALQPVYKINRDGDITTDRAADGYRLPTESEWEFAGGGMRGTSYPWGNSVATATTAIPLANFMQRDGEKDDSWRWTNPVNAFPPDLSGLYGMAGNVWEWCEDWYFERAYDALKNRSPLNPCIQQTDVPGLTHRVMRGGSYRNAPDMLRTASRGSGLPLAYAPHVGFRCGRNAN